MIELLKVSTKSNPNSVAGALANILKAQKRVDIQAIGAGSINQAVKAIAIARGFVVLSGQDLHCVPVFAEVDIDQNTKTAIKFIVNLVEKNNY